MARIVTLILLAGLATACGDSSMRLQIPFAVVFDGVPVSCAAGGDVQLTDLRFYVHDISLTDKAGRVHAFELDDDAAWQSSGLALLDLESGDAGCANGTVDLNSLLVGKIRNGDYRGLAFTLGVPFARNHGDPLLAAAPLDDAAMHWHWRGGYKFLRAGIRNAHDNFWLHLGSTGCTGTLQNIGGCNAANRVDVQLDDFEPGRDTVVLELAELATRQDLSDGTASNCSSSPAEEHCAAAFQALGLDHSNGAVAGTQRVFSSRPLQ